jgi:hypothetical protein
MKIILKNYLYLYIALILSCSPIEEQPELIYKLKGLGSIMTPWSITPNSEENIKIEVLALSPTKISEISPKIYQDSKYPLNNLKINIEKTSIEEYSDFNLHKILLTTKKPQNFEILQNEVRFHYGIDLQNDEIIVGDILFTTDKKSKEINPPKIAWNNTQPKLFLNEENILSVKILAGNHVKIKWFTTNGSIKNPYGTETLWRPSKTGKSHVIVGAYSKKTRTFTYLIKEFSISERI